MNSPLQNKLGSDGFGSRETSTKKMYLGPLKITKFVFWCDFPVKVKPKYSIVDLGCSYTFWKERVNLLTEIYFLFALDEQYNYNNTSVYLQIGFGS